VNEAYAKHYGSSTVKLVGTNLYDFIPEAERENVKAHLANVFHSGKPSIGVNPNVSNIGDARWFAWTNRVVTDVDGVGLLLHSVGRDVTEQRAADLALRQSKAELQLVSDSLPGLVSNIDPDLRYRFVNHAYAEWFGVDPLTLIGVSLKEFYGDGVFASIADKLQAALAGETVVSEREVFGRGKVRHCHVVLTPQRNESNEIIGIFAIHTDITDRKQAEQALRTSESFLTRTGAIAGVGGWELDLKANELHWSELTRNLHGVETGYRPTLDAALNFYTPESRTLMEKAVWECIEEGRPYDVEVQLTSLKGRTFWARVTGSAEFEDGELVRIAGAFQDIQERKRIQLELAESYELVRVTLDSIGDAVITTDEKGCIVWLNPVAEALTGWSKEDAHEKALADVFKIVHAGTRLPSLNPVNVALEIGKPVGLQSDTVLISRDGAEFGIEDSASPIRRPDGKILGAVLVFHDVSERQRLSREMTHRAAHDGLTGLVNRVEFEIRLARALELARLDGASHVLMFIDLDEFKVVNDACGHGAGDQLLKQVSAMLQTAVRAQDTVARLGGDEFGLLLESCTLEQGRSIAQKICDQMEVYRFAHDGRRYRVGTSIGIVPVDASWDGLPALLQAADGCCYAAKDAGRNRVHVWVDSDDKFKSRAGEAQWVNRIVAAMDENRFLLYAQRIEPVDGSRSGLHCEILLRLQEETEGPIIVPGSFMPSAERFHLASRIDRWVLNNVFGLFDSAEIRALDIDMIAVNLSGQSIGDRAFHREILRMLGSARFDVKKLCFEITETVAITNLGDAKIFIEEVRALGVKVALDDFGAGASSFGYLRNLPVDILKIDGQFVTGLLDDPLDDVAVRCFVEVAQAVGLKTVAEFVERIEVRDRLLQLGVDYAQGYLLHRPEPLAAVLKACGP
jgi:diguanylate cyclase (GGDEF)-like protein/PAS domain S-box-containing protein